MISKLKEIIKKLFYNLPIKFLLRNYILFESNPDYADNTYYVYRELLNQGYNQKYKFIWLVNNPNDFKDIHIKNVKFVSYEKCRYYYSIFSKYIIDCNKYVNKLNKYQFRIHLTHGMPIKLTKKYSSECGNVDKYLLTSEFFINFLENCVGKSKDFAIITGFPRDDQFFKEKENFQELNGYKKVILWMPTYRKHINGNGYISKYIYGVPSIDSENEIYNLNEFMKENNSLLIIKLHPAENLSFSNQLNLSNIIFTKNELLDKNKKNVYQLAQNCDALITDYSSIYYDFLIADKPIGMAIEDLNEYKNEFELYFENFEENLPGEYIYNYHDLIKFLENVCNNKDIKRNERNEKRNLYIKYIDGNASKRIVDILKEKGL